MSVKTSSFGKTTNGEMVKQFELSDGHGLIVKILNYGGAVREILCPDRNGRVANVNVGMDRVKDYESNPFWAGVICGPVAGRLAGASFYINGLKYPLSENEGGSCLHGGYRGFSRRLFDWSVEREGGVKFLRLTTQFDHLEEGFPGPIRFQGDYIVRPCGIFEFRWRGESDRPTLLSPTLHLYLNMSAFDRSGLDQVISIDGDQVLLGGGGKEERRMNVGGSRFDLRKPSSMAQGYDNPYLLNQGRGPQATLWDPSGGRKLWLQTTERCLVLYDGGGLLPTPHRALALESQGWGNGINSGTIDPPVLMPGKVLSGRTVYRFGWE
nr:hypothetical protein [uncultured Dethiosulfovibrio sp.]